MESYTAAIPRKVQVLLGQNDFTLALILALDRDWKHHHLSKGIYVDLPFDKSTNDYKCYVGSTLVTVPFFIQLRTCVMQLKAHGVMHTAEERAKLIGSPT